MNVPVFSIIIPVYNVEKYISECLNSVYSQEFEAFEVIAIDDGSADNSGNILDKYKADFHDKTTVIHQANQGQSAARNLGIQKATGDYILFIDSDDWIEPKTLQILYEKIKENSYDMLGFNNQKVYEDGIVDKTHDFMHFAEYRGSGIDYLNKYIKKKILHLQLFGYFFLNEK